MTGPKGGLKEKAEAFAEMMVQHPVNRTAESDVHRRQLMGVCASWYTEGYKQALADAAEAAKARGKYVKGGYTNAAHEIAEAILALAAEEDKLTAALKMTDELPDGWFGEEGGE
jgi:D-arabinose 1-dehydrogenase-like Zn-dependent alcohol dehydrogenase